MQGDLNEEKELETVERTVPRYKIKKKAEKEDREASAGLRENRRYKGMSNRRY